MKAKRFDHYFSKAVGGRRRLLASLFAGVVSSPLAVAPPAAGRRRKHKKKKQKGKCESNWACPLDEICKGGRCQPGCEFDEGRCPEGQTCSPATKLCTTDCSGLNRSEPVNELCPYGQICHDGPTFWCGSPCGPGGVPCPAGFLCFEEESTWGRTNTCYRAPNY